MEVVLAVIGIVFVTVGSTLLYMHSDPRFGDGLMLESFNARKEAIGARLGLVLNVVGAACQLVAVLVAVD